MFALADAVIDGLGNAIGFVLISAIGAVGSVVAYLYTQTSDNDGRIGDAETELDLNSAGPTRLDRLEEDVDEQGRYLLGDNNDPSQPGVLEEVHSLKGDVQRLEETVDANHREVSSKLDRITDSLDDEENT